MRLIDADRARETATIDLIVHHLDRQPTVDAVEVVRCKDCKHYFHYGKTSIQVAGKNIKCGWCQRRIRYDEEFRVLPDDFCSRSERRCE